jgi:hypothetical protein
MSEATMQLNPTRRLLGLAAGLPRAGGHRPAVGAALARLRLGHPGRQPLDGGRGLRMPSHF